LKGHPHAITDADPLPAACAMPSTAAVQVRANLAQLRTDERGKANTARIGGYMCASGQAVHPAFRVIQRAGDAFLGAELG
jgi:hypothetical protein